MEKLTMTCDKEYMRIAMLKHEETFKQQVLNSLCVPLDYFSQAGSVEPEYH